MQSYDPSGKMFQSATGPIDDLERKAKEIMADLPGAKVVIGSLPELGEILTSEKTGLKFKVRSILKRDRYVISLLKPDMIRRA